MTPTPPHPGERAEALVEGIDLCELAAEIERVLAIKIVEEVYDIAQERTDGYWSGHANACEEIKHRLKKAWANHDAAIAALDSEETK